MIASPGRRSSDGGLDPRERLQALRLRAVRSQSQFSVVSAVVAATLALTLLVDYIAGRPHIERVAAAIWIGSYLVFAILPLALGRRYPSWAGLVFVAHLTFWSAYSLMSSNHQHMELNSLLEVPVVGLYLGWFFAPWRARASLLFYLVVFFVFALFLRPQGAISAHGFSSELALIYAVLIAGFCLETGSHLRHRVEEQANTDPLTGSLNRRGFADRGRKMIASSRRARRPLTLIAIDFDDFKIVNDTGGHAAGDAALRESVELWSEEFGETGLVARVGGDEFAVLLQVDARAADERFAALRARSVHAWSWGVAERRPGEQLDELMRRSDAELYRAKQRRSAGPPNRDEC